MHMRLSLLAILALAAPRLAADEPPRIDRYGDPLPSGAVARLGTTRLRPEGGVNNVSFSPDGRVLASASYPTATALFLWDRQTGRLLRQLGDPQPEADSLFDHYAFLPDGKAVLSADVGGNHLILWDVATGREIRWWEGPGAGLNGLAVSSRGLAALVDGGGGIRLWDVTNNQGPKPVPIPYTVPPCGPMVFTGDGRRLVYLTTGVEVCLLDLATGKPVLHFEAGEFDTFALAPDGRAVLTASSEQGVCLWDVATGEARRLAEGKPRPLANAVEAENLELCLSADGKTALARDGQTLRLWDVASGRERRVRLRERGGRSQMGQACLSPDGKVLAAPDERNRILRLWDVQTGRPLLDYPAHTFPPERLAFSADGRTLTSFAAAIEIGCWDVARSRLLRITYLPDKLVRTPTPVMSISPGGRWAALALWRSVRVYDSRSGEMVCKREWIHGLEADAAFSPGADRLAVADQEGLIRLWEIPSGRSVRTIDTDKHGPVSWVRFVCGGTVLAGGNGAMRESGKDPAPIKDLPRVHLWDVRTGKHLGGMTADPRRWKDAAFGDEWECCSTPEGECLFVSNNGHLLTWDVAKRREAEPFEPDHADMPGPLTSGPVAVSPDGRLLARVDASGLLRLWETASGFMVYQFAGQYSSVAFGPDGRTLATGCQADGSVLLWDLPALFLVGGTAEGPQESAWHDLASGDARRAYGAVWRLAGDPQAVRLLGARLQPAQERDAAPVPRLLHQLGSPDFATRERATRALEEIGEAARGQLEAACKDGSSAEVRRRARALLGKLDPRSAERLREVRAVQVLEYVGTPPARRLLEKLAGGAPGARLTQEAKASLERLGRRPASP
jgi:WD40 repeat protein